MRILSDALGQESEQECGVEYRWWLGDYDSRVRGGVHIDVYQPRRPEHLEQNVEGARGPP
ncbi:MAG: hypothetical protein WDO69_05540 [Pseudomonadota bacterium]